MNLIIRLQVLQNYDYSFSFILLYYYFHFVTLKGLKDVAMAQRLERIIEAVVFDILNPRSLICITIQPVLLDGSVFFIYLFIFNFSLYIAFRF